VNTLSNAELGSNIAIYINACNTGLSHAGSASIAQLTSNQLQRGVYAYTMGMYFTQNANDTHISGAQLPNPPGSLPMYMVPEGAAPKPTPTAD
jgi:hypothetical protein